jgi:hypothetical protein
MLQKEKHYRILIGGGLFWMLFITLCRAIRWPNDWAEAHWLISYFDFGFHKRGLMGTILYPLINSESTGQYAELIIRLTSAAILAISTLAIFWVCMRIIKRSDFNMNSILVAGVFLTSPFIVLSGHLIGNFDSLFILMAIFASLLVMKGKAWAAAVILSIGVLIHESILIVGLPSVAFIAVLRQLRESTIPASATGAKLNIMRSLIPFALPVSIFMVLLIYHSYFVDTEQTRIRLTEHLLQYDFIRNSAHLWFPKLFTGSFFEKLEIESGHYNLRLFDRYFIARIFPSLLVIFIFAWQSFREFKYSRMIIAIAAGLSLLPLALHLIAHDVSRIWTYPLIVAIIALWGMCEIFPDGKKKLSDSALFSICCLILILFNIFMTSPLMDNEFERYADEVRVLYYFPSLTVIALMMSKRFRLKNRDA